MKKLLKNTFSYIILILIIASCENRERQDKDYLSGVYIYELRTGLFQKLEINKDYTFKQTLYSESDGDILYENYGKMYVDGIKIKLQNWLECYEVGVDENIPITEPYITYRSGGSWYKEKDNDMVHLILAEQTNYIFKKELR